MSASFQAGAGDDRRVANFLQTIERTVEANEDLRPAGIDGPRGSDGILLREGGEDILGRDAE